MNKNEIAYQEIKEMILHGVITNDSGISENTLVEKLAMSRTPIRAALQRLQFDGIVKIVPNQGIIIQEPSLEEAREKYDLRVAVEIYTLKKSVKFIREEDIVKLREILQRQAAAIDSGDFHGFLKCDKEFHTYFVKYYNNKLMTDIMINFRERFYSLSLRGLAKRTTERMKETLKEHEGIIIALEKKDYSAAIAALESHIERAFRELV